MADLNLFGQDDVHADPPLDNDQYTEGSFDPTLTPIFEPNPVHVIEVPNLDNVQPFLADYIRPRNMPSSQSSTSVFKNALNTIKEAQLKVQVKFALDHSWKFDPIKFSVSASRSSVDDSTQLSRDERKWLTGVKSGTLRALAGSSTQKMAELRSHLTWDFLSVMSLPIELSDHELEKELDGFYGDDIRQQFYDEDVDMDEGFVGNEEEVSMVMVECHTHGNGSKMNPEPMPDSILVQSPSSFQDIKDSGIFVEENFADEAGKTSPLPTPLYPQKSMFHEDCNILQPFPPTPELGRTESRDVGRGDESRVSQNGEVQAENSIFELLDNEYHTAQASAGIVVDHDIHTMDAQTLDSSFFLIDDQPGLLEAKPEQDFLAQELHAYPTDGRIKVDNSHAEHSYQVIGLQRGGSRDDKLEEPVYQSAPIAPTLCGSYSFADHCYSSMAHDLNSDSLVNLQIQNQPYYEIGGGEDYCLIPSFTHMDGSIGDEPRPPPEVDNGAGAQILRELNTQIVSQDLIQQYPDEFSTSAAAEYGEAHWNGAAIQFAPDASLAGQYAKQFDCAEDVLANNNAMDVSPVRSNIDQPFGCYMNSPVEGYFPRTPLPSSPQTLPFQTPQTQSNVQPVIPRTPPARMERNSNDSSPASPSTAHRSAMTGYRFHGTGHTVRDVFNSPKLRLKPSSRILRREGQEETRQFKNEAEDTIVLVPRISDVVWNHNNKKSSDEEKGEVVSVNPSDAKERKNECEQNEWTKRSLIVSKKPPKGGETKKATVHAKNIPSGDVDETDLSAKTQEIYPRKTRKSHPTMEAEETGNMVKQSSNPSTAIVNSIFQNQVLQVKTSPRMLDTSPHIKDESQPSEKAVNSAQRENILGQAAKKEVALPRKNKTSEAKVDCKSSEPAKRGELLTTAPQAIEKAGVVKRKARSSLLSTDGEQPVPIATADHVASHVNKKPKRARRT